MLKINIGKLKRNGYKKGVSKEKMIKTNREIMSN